MRRKFGRRSLIKNQYSLLLCFRSCMECLSGLDHAVPATPEPDDLVPYRGIGDA